MYWNCGKIYKVSLGVLWVLDLLLEFDLKSTSTYFSMLGWKVHSCSSLSHRWVLYSLNSVLKSTDSMYSFSQLLTTAEFRVVYRLTLGWKVHSSNSFARRVSASTALLPKSIVSYQHFSISYLGITCQRNKFKSSGVRQIRET
jgi:hypothetical protein